MSVTQFIHNVNSGIYQANVFAQKCHVDDVHVSRVHLRVHIRWETLVADHLLSGRLGGMNIGHMYQHTIHGNVEGEMIFGFTEKKNVKRTFRRLKLWCPLHGYTDFNEYNCTR